MAKINLNAINTRLILSFSIIGVLMVSLVVITILQMGKIVDMGTKVLYFNQPSRMYVIYLQSGIEQTNVNLANYLLTQKATFKASRQSVWDKEIKSAFDSLDSYQAHWEEAEFYILYDKIKRQAEKINSLQSALESEVRSGSGSVSLDVYNYPYLESDTLFLEDGEFQSWLNDQLASVGGDENSDLIQRYQAELLPLTNELNNTTNQFFNLLREKALQSADKINGRVATFGIITFALIIISLLLAYLLFRYVRDKIMRSINIVKREINILAQGNLPEKRFKSDDELDIVLEEISELSANLSNVKSFALEVGKGSFDNDISVFNNEGEIGHSLAEMRDSLKKVADEDRKRNWANQGYAEFGDILRKNSDNLAAMSDAVITQMVRYLKANQGGIFIKEQVGDDEVLELKASYAYDRKKFVEKQLAIGQGLVGQCYLEKEPIYLKEVPKEYISITSGLGKATPSYLYIQPLIFNEEVFGVIEIASFADFDEHERLFIERQAESIASSISNVKINQNTKKLLEESQELTEQMRSQEEEMRQNMEELQATQEEMHRNQQEMQEKGEFFDTILAQSKVGIVVSSDRGTINFANKLAAQLLGQSESQLKGQLTQNLIERYESITENVQAGKLKNGQDVLISKKESPLKGEDAVIYSFMPLAESAGKDDERVAELLAKEKRLLQQIEDMQNALSQPKSQETWIKEAKAMNDQLKNQLEENASLLKAAIDKRTG